MPQSAYDPEILYDHYIEDPFHPDNHIPLPSKDK